GHRPRDGSVVSFLHCMNDPQPEGHMASYIGRRKLLAAFGGAAAAWPLAARAQQAMPVVGFLSGRSPGSDAHLVEGFRRGLRENGFTESQNVSLEFRWADGRLDRLPAMAGELIERKVAGLFSRAAGGAGSASRWRSVIVA